MYNYCLYISYLGYKYKGSSYINFGPTIECLIREIFSNIGVNIFKFYVVSRTDKKVNAYSQLVWVKVDTDIKSKFLKLSNSIKSLSNESILLSKFSEDKDSKLFIKSKLKKRNYLLKLTTKITALSINRYILIDDKIINLLIKVIKEINGKLINYGYLVSSFEKKYFEDLKEIKFRFKKIKLSEGLVNHYIFVTSKRFLHKQIRILIGSLINLVRFNKELIVSDVISIINNGDIRKYNNCIPGNYLYLL